jgi:hypothetical protein
MKATLILSTIAVVSVISTAASAQSFPASYGNSSAMISVPAPPASTVLNTNTVDRAYAPRPHRIHATSRR